MTRLRSACDMPRVVGKAGGPLAPLLRPDTAPVADFGGMAGIRLERAFIQ